MNILVTGGAGFIGSNLIDYLILKDCKITVVDDLSTGKLSNLSNVIDRIIFYQEKIESFNFNNLNKIDTVIHLAAQPSVPISIDNFRSSSSTNLLSSISVIEYCRKNFIPLVYASSSAIYGNLEIGNDESSKVNLLSPYATDKYALELYARIAHKLYQLSSIGLRFFNVYGPRQDPSSPYSGVISIFADRLIQNSNIRINGGYQTRDFIYIKDIVESIFLSVQIASSNVVCKQVNVLTGRSTSIEEIANLMINMIGVSVDKEYHDLVPGDPEKSEGTFNKMEELLGLNTNNMVSVNDGLQETIDFIISNSK